MKIEITKVEGLKELETQLSRLGKEYGDPKYALQALRPALKKAAQVIEEDVYNSTPVETGRLKESTKTRVMKTSAKNKKTLGQDAVIHAEVGWTWVKGQSLWFQSLAVEFGTSDTPARATLRSALDKNTDTAIKTFKDELGPAIEKKAVALGKKFGK